MTTRAQAATAATVAPALGVRYSRNPMATFNGAANDDSTKENQALYRAATESLDIKFDGSTTGLKLFIDQITNRAAQYGWNTTLGTLLSKYGEVSIADLSTRAEN